MATVHISETDAAGDFPGLLARVRSGDDFIVESGNEQIAIVRASESQHRTLDETLALLKARTKGRGYEAVMDPEYAADMEDIIRNRKPVDHSAWD